MQTTCFPTPESALYNLLSCATLPCTQLRRTGASFACLRTNHLTHLFQTCSITKLTSRSFCSWNHPVLQTRAAADTVCFDVSILYWSRQATSSFVFPVFVLSLPCNLLVLTRRKIDLAVLSRPPNCNINLSYNCWLYRVTIKHAVFHHIDTVSCYMQTWLMISLKGVQFGSWFSNKWCNLNHDFLFRRAIWIMISQ